MRRVVCNPPLATRKGETGELCDAVLHGSGGLALFEAKGVFIRDEDVLSEDPMAFPAAVLKQYANPSSSAGRAKGVHQLVRAVRILGAGEAQLDGLRHGMTVYPVLVAFDELISAPGTLDILRAEFARAVANEGGRFPLRVGQVYVAQLTVMTVSDVELLDRLVERKELLEVLRAYTKEPALRSFHDHLTEHQEDYGVAIHGRQVTEIADAHFEQAKAILFGAERGT